jgi:hypothetical protein
MKGDIKMLYKEKIKNERVDEILNKRNINKISVSFSGGRTSGMMAKVLIDYCKRNNIECVFTFANTGLEHEGTYEFVENCDKFFNLNLVKVETVVNQEKGIGVKSKVVSYSELTKGGELFERVVSKHGLPSRATPHCTTYLKVYPMEHYLRSIGYKRRKYFTAIGIRADEIDRVSSKFEEYKLLYPLADIGINKQDVFDFWHDQPFDLKIPDNYGNCITCWKKSEKKLFDIYMKTPEAFNHFLKFDELYSETNTFGKGRRTMFRGCKSTIDLINDAKNYHDEKYFSEQLNMSFGCEESCEVYSEEYLKNV